MTAERPRVAVVTFPGSNDDRDALLALEQVGAVAVPVWHAEERLNEVSAVVLPGGFSYGDYLRCGAIARFSPAMKTVTDFAADGGLVLGICNGFQILCEAGLLPGVLRPNASLSFVCRDVVVDNPNGSVGSVAGVCNEDGNVMGLMPHPEHAIDPLLGSTDGALILGGLVQAARAISRQSAATTAV